MTSSDSSESVIHMEGFVSDTQVAKSGIEVFMRQSCYPANHFIHPVDQVFVPDDADLFVADTIHPLDSSFDDLLVPPLYKVLGHSKVSKPGIPKWKQAILKSKSIREKQIIEDWNLFTEFCRPAPRGVSKLLSDTFSSTSLPPCDLAKMARKILLSYFLIRMSQECR